VASLQRIIMKSLREYLNESEDHYSRPVRGDNFAINIREECLLETYICDETSDGIVLHADEKMMGLLESYGFLSEGDFGQLAQSVATAPVKPVASMEAHNHDDQDAEAGEYDYEGDMAKDDLETIVRAARRLTGMLDDNENMPEWVQSKINKAADYVDTAADYIESNQDERIEESSDEPNPVARAVLHRIMMQHPGVLAAHGPAKVMDAVDELADYVGDVDEIGTSDVSAWTQNVIRMLAAQPNKSLDEQDMDEAKYQGREVPLGKPMAGDVKKSKVYVRGPKGNVVKVNFGQKGMKIKKSIPGRRKNFRARHNCDNPGPRWKARYWSCRAW
jgi:hypothetical protein